MSRRRADVVVIGGGSTGTSVAFHLAEAGVAVTLVERGSLGGGSTCRAAGGVRAQFSDEVNIRIANRSLAAFRDFGRRPGWEIDFKQVGYLFVLARQADVEEFERNVTLQNEYGVPSRMVDARGVRALSPLVQGDDIIAGAFSPEDGHATPEAVVQGYAVAARRYGAHIRTRCEVHEIVVAGGEITRVVTNQGDIETCTVVCAAGPWSQQCGAMVGVHLPVTPLRRQVLFTEPMTDLPAELPMTIDFTSSFYFHREGPGLLYGMSYTGERPGFDTDTSDNWLPDLMEAGQRRAPRVVEAGVKGGWAGLYEMTPDHNAIIGEARGVSRFLYATGFSGHGFLQAPAVGEIVRDLVLNREPVVDASALAVERFSAAQLRPEFNVV